jgi:hypothetical protein
MKNPFLPLAAFFDAKSFLSFRLWQFSLQNSFRDYPYYFLFAALLRYPLRSWHGFMHYRQLVRSSHGEPLNGTTSLCDLARTVADHRLLIAPGFCMKPYDYEKGRSTCPVGHFNHECRLLNDLTVLHHKEKWPKPCFTCGIAPLAVRAVDLRADVYIMTSAMDIAKDVYIPALQYRGAVYGLFFLCPYSLEPFTFGLAIAGIKGALITFCKGECKDHAEWTKADVGIKNDQTFLAENVWADVFTQLNKLKFHRSLQKNDYNFDGHVYRVM